MNYVEAEILQVYKTKERELATKKRTECNGGCWPAREFDIISAHFTTSRFKGELMTVFFCKVCLRPCKTKLSVEITQRQVTCRLSYSHWGIELTSGIPAFLEAIVHNTLVGILIFQKAKFLSKKAEEFASYFHSLLIHLLAIRSVALSQSCVLKFFGVFQFPWVREGSNLSHEQKSKYVCECDLWICCTTESQPDCRGHWCVKCWKLCSTSVCDGRFRIVLCFYPSHQMAILILSWNTHRQRNTVMAATVEVNVLSVLITIP